MNALQLTHMSGPNAEVIREVLGQSYAIASANDDLRPVQVIEANHALADHAYGSNLAQLLRARRIDELNRIHADVLGEVAVSSESLTRLDPTAFSLMVLRPEIVECAADYEALIAARGLVIMMNKQTSIRFEQYWGMYHHGLIHPDSYMDFPTRTLNYVHKPLRLMIISDPHGVVRGESVSEYLHSFKGRQGCDQPGTLRGGIAYTAISACLDQADKLKFRSGKDTLALDPIGAYRQLASNAIPSDGLHNSADSPLLYYAGQAIHVPDRHEVLRDLSMLCSEEEIDSIAEALHTNTV